MLIEDFPREECKYTKLGGIYFVNHSPEQIALVADSLLSWFVQLKTELYHRGEVWHPIDHAGQGFSSPGCYLAAAVDLKDGSGEFARAVRNLG